MEETDIRKKVAAELREEYRDCGTPETYGSFTKTKFMVPMGDGVRLETFVYLPGDGDKVYPVVLQRTCYPFWDVTMQIHGEELAKRGYVFLYQYCRGQNGSEGEWEPNIYERQDGIDTIDWIRSQPWAGRIGVWGRSYGALIGWAMADAVKGKVTSMFLGVYGTDRFASAYQKGAFRHDVLTSWTMENAGFPIEADYLESCKYMPQAQVDEALWGEKISWYRDYILNDKIEDPYWQEGWWKELREIPAKTEIPIYMVSGWYDHHHGSSMLTWNRLNEKAKEHSWLEVTGLDHIGFPCLQDRETEHDKKDEVKKMLSWFELTLVKGETPAKRMRFYEIGADAWTEVEETAAWTEAEKPGKAAGPEAGEPGRAAGPELAYYLEAGGEKRLSEKAPEEASAASYVYDPKDPVMTHGAESLLHTRGEIGSLLQPEPDYRPDVLSFLSEPLKEDARIFGKIKVQLWVATDCEDTAFTAKLLEVWPDGRAYNIRSSIAVLSSCCGEYVPETPTLVEIEMWDIFYRVKEGSRLRLDVSSSDFPQYSIHSNQKGPWALQTGCKKAVQKILCGPEYPSGVVLPLV